LTALARRDAVEEVPLPEPPDLPARPEAALVGAEVAVPGKADDPARDDNAGTKDLQPEFGGPLAGLLPFDMQPLLHGADALFEQLARLTESREGSSSLLALAPWLVVAGAVAGELVLVLKGCVASQPGPEASLPGDPLAPVEDEP
jgi:hypothetical protein